VLRRKSRQELCLAFTCSSPRPIVNYRPDTGAEQHGHPGNASGASSRT